MKKFLVFLLSLTICLTPTIVFSGAAEKWEILENNYDHTKNTVNVTAKKVGQSAANNSVYKVQVPVNASTLGSTVKMMLKGGVASAALYGLVEGVGWIIDQGSKTILKPKEPVQANVPYYFYENRRPSVISYSRSSGANAALEWYKTNRPDLQFTGVSLTTATGNNEYAAYACYVYQGGTYCDDPILQIKVNPNYNPNLEPEYIPVSDSELGNEILGNGTEPNSRPQPSPDIITDAYSPNNLVSDAPAPQQTNQALENANPQPEKEPEGKSETEKEKDETGAETGKETSKFELPNFCEWAPAVCAFFTVQKQDNKDLKENQKEDIAQNKTFFESVKDFFDWTKKEPEQDNSDNDLPVTTPEPFDTSVFSKDRFSVSRQCPVPEQHTISLSGISVNFAFDLKPICSVLELARPALIACSYLYACYMVIGAARNG